ncbi:MAG: 30S ribosomal protein S16 [Bradyrhizobiaceae bacterium]|nr:30S ribosomal protein S16 [Bradyrhizobiaceae bacterium]
MVKLRLRRRGRKKHPFYDIVAIDGRARRDGAAIERVGWVDPMTTPKNVVVNAERAIYWLNVGAQPTDIVNQIFSREGVLLQRHLGFKGASAEEIATAVAQHRERATERYNRLKARRKERARKAEEAAKEAQNAPAPEPVAEEAPAAEAAAAEAPAESAE